MDNPITEVRRGYSYFRLGLRIVWRSVVDFMVDDAWTQAAALAFYTSLSLAPLLILLIHITSFMGGGFEERVLAEVRQLVGPQVADVMDVIVETVRSGESEEVPVVLSIIVALFSGTLAFAHLRNSLNVIWGVPFPKGKEIQSWLMGRVRSLGLMGGITFLILLSLGISTVLGLFVSSGGRLWSTMEWIGSIVAYTLIFAMIYKMLPNIHIRWRDVAFGSLVTVALFMAGNYGISQYLRYSTLGSAYGTAGSLFVMLVWVYYVACLVFFGAEITFVYVHRRSLKLVSPETPSLPESP
ncbi:YihY/virulence factor BrkB family protein [bacterium]|nr:YihY/virulence factor BrkB family protein [bacterium]MBU1984501.1 YihY/virulence factor BrkB family protein [bacterium]